MTTENIKSVQILHIDENDENIEHNSVDKALKVIIEGQIQSLDQCYFTVVAGIEYRGVEYNIHMERDALSGSEADWEPSETEGDFSKFINLTNDENEVEIIEILDGISNAVVSHFQSAGMN